MKESNQQRKQREASKRRKQYFAPYLFAAMLRGYASRRRQAKG